MTLKIARTLGPFEDADGRVAITTTFEHDRERRTFYTTWAFSEELIEYINDPDGDKVIAGVILEHVRAALKVMK